jgi:hypothetical protein
MILEIFNQGIYYMPIRGPALPRASLSPLWFYVLD